MGELEQKLENILGNPQAMAQIMSLAQSLNLGGTNQTPTDQAPPQTPPAQEQPQAAPDAPPPQEQAQAAPDAPPPQEQAQAAPAAPAPAPAKAPPQPQSSPVPDLTGLLGGLDPGTLSAAASLIGQFPGGDGGDDKRVALLNALRPFVKEERYAKLDKAIQIAKLSRLIRSGLDLFRAHKEGSHV